MLLYVCLAFYSKFVTTVTTRLAGRNLVPMLNTVIAVISLVRFISWFVW